MIGRNPILTRSQRDWSKAALQPAMLLYLLMIPALWAALTVILLNEQERTLDSAIQQGSNLARLFEQNTTAMLQGVDRTLLLLRQEYERNPDAFDLSRLVKRATFTDDLTIQFAITGPAGDAKGLISPNGAVATATFADREWFQQQRYAKNDELILSTPVASRLSKKWSIILSRRLRNADGNFAGTIAASIDPQFIGTFYKTIDVGEHGSVVLRNLDGVILASGGTIGPVMGRQVMQPVLRDALANSPIGHYWGGGAVDGIDRLVSYRTSQSLPIITMVGLARNDIFARYERTQLIFLLTAVILTLLLLIGALADIRHRIRLDRTSAAQQLAEKHLERTKTFLDTVIENLPLPIVVKNPNTLRFELVNRAYEHFIGLPREKIIGRTVYDLFRRKDAETISNSDKEASSLDSRLVATEFELHTPANGTRLITTTRLVVHDDNGGPSHLITVIDDITKRRESENKIVYMAHYDAVTDLPNRALLQERLRQELTRIGHGVSLAVLCLDLDNFKAVNDTLGHPVGDALLRSVAERLRSCVRETDTVARFGGDEFAILQAAIKDSTEVTVLARRIVEAILAPFDLSGHIVNIGISVGIAIAPNDGVNPDQLLKNADLALYRAKSEGRGLYRFYEPEMDMRMRARRTLELDLRKALVNGEFELFYQPLVNLQQNEVCGLEALLRWRHPERGMVSPSEFIPIAEDIGIIGPIGEWVLRQACAEAKTWPEHSIVAVNLSPSQFKSENLVQVVISALAVSGLQARRLELEITESALLQNNELTRATLHQLRNLGVRISMDDFGTGYSSLGYLQSFPFDKIKIDRSFIQTLSSGHGSVAILQAIVSLAKSMNMTTIAEGVESAEQLEIVRAEGCDEMQGYLFSPAIPARDIGRFFPKQANFVETAA